MLQAGQTIGIDLPQRILVFEDAGGQVFIAHNDPFFLADRHGISGQDERLQMIAMALQGLANAATGS
ncbi:hypothetical protein BH23ACT9_BH23ACT9_35530 [soil metagenome]